MKRWLILTVIGGLFMLPAVQVAESPQHYLLMQKIMNILSENNFSQLKDICEEKFSVNFEPPFELYGYLTVAEFTNAFNLKISQFETENIEWVSKQLEERFAVQSLNIVFKNKRSEKYTYYKFIFFLTKKISYYDFLLFSIKKDEEWKVYHIRGLKI